MVLSPSKILSGGGKIEDVYAKLKELEEKISTPLIKYETFGLTVTCSANSRSYFNLGTLTVPDGYEPIGVLQKLARQDWWQVSYCLYGSDVTILNAVVYNYYTESITYSLQATVLYIKTS